jgi:hypothetical protein
MKKLIAGITATCLLGLGMTGCFLNPASNDDEVDVKLGDISSIAAGTTQHVTAKIDANVPITEIGFNITNSAGEDVTAKLFTVQRLNIELGTKEKIEIGNNKDMYITITPNSAICNGTYTLNLTVVAGSASLTKHDEFEVTGGTCESGQVETELTARTVFVGNQSSTEGSALDVDEMVVYKSSQLKDNATSQAAVDAWFGIVQSKATIMAPSAATGFAPITQNWSVKNATKFLKVSVDFNSIKTQSAIDALWSGSGSASLAIAAGDVIVVQTVGGNYRLLLIESASNETNGVVTVKGKIK